MNYKSFILFCLGAIVTFLITSLFKGNFEWDNLIPIIVGGLIGTAFASYKGKS